MHGICFQSVGRVAWQSLDDPRIEKGTDAIVRVRLAGLCGSDLHPFFGREKGLDPGTVMGHEFVGEVVEAGPAVREFRPGEVVCAPFTTSCGSCFYCQRGLTARCESGELFGWRSGGRGLHGAQAELVRVPLADATLVRLGDRAPEIGLLLGDNLSTAIFGAEMAAARPGDWHVVIGCGTVGLLSILACQARGAENLLACDPRPRRAAMANGLGARAFTDAGELRAALMERTEGRGADAVMELVGLPDAQRLAFSLIRPGGTMSVIGCHCTPEFAFSPGDAYDRNLNYRTGRCSARHYMDRQEGLVRRFERELLSLVTHRFSPASAGEAYETFSTGRDGCLKAVLDFDLRDTG